MNKQIVFVIGLFCFFTSCATNRFETDSGQVIHDFFFPEYYSDRPCVIWDTIYLPVDSTYLVRSFFLQKINTVYEKDVSSFLDFTRPCSDSTHTLRDDMAAVIHTPDKVYVADTNFLLEGSLVVYSLSNHKWLGQLYPNAKTSSSVNQEHGCSMTGELSQFISVLTDRCYSIAHRYSIVYDGYTFNIDNLSIPMNYVRFIILPTKDNNRVVH
jgi:hypothetical protein